MHSLTRFLPTFLTALLITTYAWGDEARKPASQQSSSTLQAQLEQHQQKLSELERLVREQQKLLVALQQQLSTREVPHSAPSTPVSNGSVHAEKAVQSVQRNGRLENAAEIAVTRAPAPSPAMATSAQEKSAPLTAGWTGSHPYIRSVDGNFRMQFGGRMQFDWRSYTGTVTPPSSFFVRRARFEAEGELFKHYEYKVQADFADTGSALLRDGFVNINYNPAAQFQFGQSKAPFSQEALQSSKYLDFVERSSVNGLTPGRTPGVMLHGELAGARVEYYAGAFNGRGILGANTASTPEGYLRLRFTPFKTAGPDLLKNFSLGGAFANGRHNGVNSFRGRTASRSVTFFRRVPVNGEIVRANAEFWWRYKNWSLRGEYDQTHQYRESLGVGGSNLPGVIGKGYVLQTTYLLTGETKTTGGITPASTFLATDGGLGAWELAFRYENLQMSDAVNSNRGEAFTFGVNWWLTKFVRYQSNFVLERLKDPLRTPTPGDTDSFAYLSRVQVIF